MAVAGFSFRRCRACRTLWAEDPPVPTSTAPLYRDGGYYVKPGTGAAAERVLPGYKDYLADRPHIEAKFVEILEHMERYVPPGRLLDVGSGPGFLISAANERGWRASGIDLNDWAVRYARDELGLEVRHGMLEPGAFEDSAFDAVTMMDLVEHVAEPGALVREAARITRPGGVLVLLTPDAGSPVSRALGRRWPEVQRVSEHLVLLSVEGAVRLLARHGFDSLGWHYVGKTSSLRTLLADVAPAAPRLAELARPAVDRTSVGRLEFELDPRTKFVLYAKRTDSHATAARPPRLPKRYRPGRATEEAVLEELQMLGRSRRVCDWMFEQFADRVRGDVVEVGAGVGTFTARVLDAGAESMLLVEPEASCASELERRFGGDPRVSVARESLPDAPSLAKRAGTVDFVLCQNVLEHIEDHAAAVAAMARSLRSGGRLTLLVPALSRLFGSLDLTYGHWRRYTPAVLRQVVEAAGLELDDLYYFNALGIPGWWLKNHGGSTGIGPLALRSYEALVVPWRALERRIRPPVGLSLIVHARRG